MSEAPRAGIGDNAPPLDSVDYLKAHLDEMFAELSAEVMQHDMARFKLPAELVTDEHCGQVVKWVADLKKIAASAERTRKEKGAPYLAAQRTINDWFAELVAGLEASAKELERNVGVYNRAKAERERAERLQREQEARARAEAARLEEQRQRDAADAAARAAEEAAARIRQAATEEARASAAADMRAADAQAEILRDQAEYAGAEASKSERQADANARAAQGSTARLSRVATEGATSSVTQRWTFTVVDWTALRATLGPLGPHLDNGVIETTIARVVRQESAGGATPTFALAGVDVHQEHKTNIRAARA